MSEYSVDIFSRPLGLDFHHSNNSNSLIVHTLSKNSIAEKLGIQINDILIAIEGQSITNVEFKIAYTLFEKQSLPFTATFITKSEENETEQKQILSNEYDGSHSEHLSLTDANTRSNSEEISLPQTLTLPISDSHSNHQITGSMATNRGSIVSDNKILTMHFFDVIGKYNNMKGNANQFMLSSKSLYNGYHTFSVKILKCDLYRQEIGIVSNLDQTICIDMNDGICGTPKFGARAVCGNILQTNQIYYASYNKDNTIRCKRDIVCDSSMDWRVGSIVTVKCDLNKGSVRFFINHKKVRKTISLEKNMAFHPIISYFGDCQYELVDFNSK